MWRRNLKSKFRFLSKNWRVNYGFDRVQQQIDSKDTSHFTPNNGYYWAFIALFFLCWGLRFFWTDDSFPPQGTMERPSTLSMENRQTLTGDVLFKGMALKLSEITDFGQMEKLLRFFAMRPFILDSVPSCVPLYKESFVVSSPYGQRFHPIHQITRHHFGVDFAATKGTPIYCTAAGTVTHIGNDPNGHGLHVMVTHGHGFVTLYGHMDQVAVTIGEKVPPHEYIGTVGNSGLSTGPHLHYETIKDGNRLDPAPSFNIKYDVYRRLSQSN
ncbi:M23 family metallopeptidase [Flagellimonas meridianipacifica]|uniref:Peptidase M23-like protein n=1 Tax=Flagellimonas meridianipacifica TaxID=1080225 RepID=A0A2T0MF87_9FLAO|nr:M23 family metallopeptidase [Allomuricauda pacifica]PRX56241.1 peptidase M23-like protein [Allomuricauda pacifica]